jgi:hypothetical protein
MHSVNGIVASAVYDFELAESSISLKGAPASEKIYRVDFFVNAIFSGLTNYVINVTFVSALTVLAQMHHKPHKPISWVPVQAH